MVGRFHNPGLKVLAFETVPNDRVVVLRVPDLVGWYVQQGSKRGFLAHDHQGLLNIQFYEAT